MENLKLEKEQYLKIYIRVIYQTNIKEWLIFIIIGSKKILSNKRLKWKMNKFLIINYFLNLWNLYHYNKNVIINITVLNNIENNGFKVWIKKTIMI